MKATDILMKPKRRWREECDIHRHEQIEMALAISRPLSPDEQVPISITAIKKKELSI